MAHKHTQNQIDEVINKWRGKHAVEKMIGEYSFAQTLDHSRIIDHTLAQSPGGRFK